MGQTKLYGKRIRKGSANRENYLYCIFEALRENQIFVRYFKQPKLENYLRISIGTREEMEALFAFLETYLQQENEKVID